MPTDTDKNDRPKPSLLSKASVKEKGKGVRKVEKKRKRGQTIAWFVLVDDLEKGGGVTGSAQSVCTGVERRLSWPAFTYHTDFIPISYRFCPNPESNIDYPGTWHRSQLAPRAMNPSFRLITNHQSLITDSALRPVGRTIYHFVLSNNEFEC